VGAANALRDTACLISRNENDSAEVPGKSTWRLQKSAADFLWSGKVLNLRTDSNCHAAVRFPTIAQNNFIICLRLNVAELDFRTTDLRYADK
jgi:hypothetical protein